MNFVFLYTSNLGKRQTYWHTLLQPIIDHTVDTLCLDDYFQINEGDAAFSNPPPHTNIVLNGYFQSPKFFENMDFEKLDLLIDTKIRMPNTVSMHFRLGDYKYLQDCHPIMEIDYYKNALHYILLMDPSVDRVCYFCEDEDIDTVRGSIEALKQEFSDIDFYRRRESTDWEEMLSMSGCTHNIIANSSFSWWGAYLNKNPDKIVCYPSTWFGPSIPKDVAPMFPEKWIKI